MKLAGRIAIITGGGSGIGREASKLFASEGATVIVADRDLDAATMVAEDIGLPAATPNPIALTLPGRPRSRR